MNAYARSGKIRHVNAPRRGGVVNDMPAMPPRIIEATLQCADAGLLAEGPFWYDEQLWWVDIENGFLRSMDIHGKLTNHFCFGQRVGAAVPSGGGHFLVALEREIVQLNLDSGSWQTVARPGDIPEGCRFNDGKCDPRGRWVIGTMNMSGERRTSYLYSLQHDHSFHRLKAGVSISNGLAWSADGHTMYYIDTPELCVFAYDYHPGDGTISGERVILRFPEKEGWPDGMTIDREGRLWIGFWDGWAVRCYQPETGVCEAIIPMPCARPTSCCFGGPGLSRLFITTASVGLSDEALLDQPSAGSLFVCDPGTSGSLMYTRNAGP